MGRETVRFAEGAVSIDCAKAAPGSACRRGVPVGRRELEAAVLYMVSIAIGKFQF